MNDQSYETAGTPEVIKTAKTTETVKTEAAKTPGETESAKVLEAMNKLQKDLRITRIFICIVSVLMLCILAGGLFVYLRLQELIASLAPMLEQSFEKLSALDIESFNKALSGLDTEELSKSLETLNHVVESLKDFSDTLKSFFSLPGL